MGKYLAMTLLSLLLGNTDVTTDVTPDANIPASENVETENSATDESVLVGNGALISFDTVDVYGNKVSQDMLQGSRLVMLNLWEPWCGPCVNEMPDLNALYQYYKDKGLLVVGAYSTTGMDADAKDLVEELGITYPIIKCNNSINSIEQNYVPATYLLDNTGRIITLEPFAGSRDYKAWEAIILQYLK